MKKVAFLCCADTHTKSPHRRPDAYEHDRSLECFRQSFDAIGREVVEIDWRQATHRWDCFEAVIIGTTWDYSDHQREFLATLDDISSWTRLLNPAPLVRWNLSKRYLQTLARCSVSTIPTVWASSVCTDSISRCFDSFETDTLVLKPEVGASGIGQHVIHRTRGDQFEVPCTSGTMLIQPFVESIFDIGEASLVFAGKTFSHALLKRPQNGDYRVQSLYGGIELPLTPTESQLRVAYHAIEAIDPRILYARVDLVRLKDGAWAVIELELIEPYLYPSFGPDFPYLLGEEYLRQQELCSMDHNTASAKARSTSSFEYA